MKEQKIVEKEKELRDRTRRVAEISKQAKEKQKAMSKSPLRPTNSKTPKSKQTSSQKFQT